MKEPIKETREWENHDKRTIQTSLYRWLGGEDNE